MSKSHRRRHKQQRTKAFGPTGPLATETRRAAGVAGGGARRRWPLLRATIVFVVIVGLFYVGYSMPSLRESLFAPNLRLHTAAAARILAVSGYDVQVVDQTINSPRFSVSVHRGCDAAEPTVLFVAAVIAFPASVRRKLLGIAAGVAALQLFNLVRIVTLFCTGVHFPSAFELMHIHVWQTVFIFAAVLLWVVWAWWATTPAKRATDARA